MEIKVNVTAYSPLSDKKKTFYDGDLIFENYSIILNESKRTIKPGFFKSLDDIAEEIKEAVIAETEGLEPFKREDVNLNYDSDVKNNFEGPRGYTDYTGSYLQRPLNDSEMEKLIREVDRRIRPILYDVGKYHGKDLKL